MSRATRVAAVGFGLLLRCSPSTDVLPPTGQLLLYVDTDAPLPAGPGTPRSALLPVPLFDRVRFDAAPSADGGSCDCSREFDVTEDLVKSGQVSFGVLASLAGHGTIRVRLFRAAATVEGEPDPGSTIDMTFALPAVGSEGVAPFTLFLPTDHVGVRRGTISPLSPRAGAPSPYHVGTWPGARRKNCTAAPPAGEVCVPGGAFWMGNVAAANQGPDSGNVSRLVVMSPYYLDATEMTVGAYRALGGQSDLPWSGTTGCGPEDYCTFTASPGRNDGLPMNCVLWSQARAACQKQGKDLPTEAQYEYAASGLSGQPFVWGTDVPQCGDVVFERGGYGYFAGYSQECVPMGTNTDCGGAPAGGLGLGGPLPPMSGARDALRIELPGWTGTIYDLAGNIDELTRDAWQPESGSCWSRRGVYTDPFCSDPTTTEVTARGGDWTQGPTGCLAADRQETPDNVIGPYLGFRCARSAR